MKHWIFFLILLFSTAIPLMAQRHFYPSRPGDDVVRYEGMVYGVKRGINCPRLYYTSNALRNLPHEFLLKKSYGCFVEMPLWGKFTIAPEFNVQQRGDSTTFKFAGHKVGYSLLAKYVSVRTPVYCYFPVSDLVKPYLFLGPDFGVAVKGEINGYGQTVGINSRNINRWYVGTLSGAGVRVNVPLRWITMVLKLEAALNMGLLDTYSKAEKEGTAHPLNVQAYTIDGHRYSRGLEVHLGLGFFLNKIDGCGRF